MGNGMNKILPGLYVGNIRDAKDTKQLEDNNITHIVAIHDNARKLHHDKEYLVIVANDVASQDLSQYFPAINDFIHQARLNHGAVLIHCLAGVSRSVTVTTAYIMTSTGLGWRDALNSVRGARRCANPNFGFQRQLLAFEHEKLPEERERLLTKYPPSPYHDLEECRKLIAIHKEWVLKGDDPDKDTYALPHKAYGQKSSDEKVDQTGKKTENDSEDKSGDEKKDCQATAAKDANMEEIDAKVDALFKSDL